MYFFFYVLHLNEIDTLLLFFLFQQPVFFTQKKIWTINQYISYPMNQSVIFVCFDIETSGPCFRDNFIVSIGACSVDINEQRKENIRINLYEPSKSHIFDHDTFNNFWIPNMKTLTELKRDRETPQQGIGRLLNWVDSLYQRYERVVFVGDNSEFDYSWINYYIRSFSTGRDQLTYRNGVYVGNLVSIPDVLHGICKSIVAKSRKMDQLKFLLGDNMIMVPNTHFPDEDAECIVLNFIRIIKKYEISY